MAGNGSKKVKPAIQHVKLKIKCNKDGTESLFAVKRNIKIRMLLHIFCQRASVQYRSTRFVFNHRQFSHDRTPNQLGLNDFDQIDAFVDGTRA